MTIHASDTTYIEKFTFNEQINYKPSEVNFNQVLEAIHKSDIQIKDMSINETNLEDVFLKLTKS